MNFYMFSYLMLITITTFFLIVLRKYHTIRWGLFLLFSVILLGGYFSYVIFIRGCFSVLVNQIIFPMLRPFFFLGSSLLLINIAIADKKFTISPFSEQFFVATIIFLIRECTHNSNLIFEKYLDAPDTRVITGHVRSQYIIVYILVVGFAVFLFKNSLGKSPYLEISPSISKRALYQLLVILGLNTAYLISIYTHWGNGDIVFLLMVLIEFASYVNLLSKISSENEALLSTELTTSRHLQHLQEKQFQMAMSNQALLNQKSHDLKHYISYLKNAKHNDSISKIVEDLESTVNSFDISIKTGNNDLDIILTEKNQQCMDSGISFHCLANGALLAYINPVDLFVLFGNIMDNAIEYLKGILEPEKKIIYLSVTEKSGMIRIEESNYLESPLVLVNNFPQTSKANTDYHGFGLKSINSICNKYRGRMNIQTDNKIYKLVIFLPNLKVVQ